MELLDRDLQVAIKMEQNMLVQLAAVLEQLEVHLGQAEAATFLIMED
jgi:hypothetical protein